MCGWHHRFVSGRLSVLAGIALILTAPDVSSATDHPMSAEWLVDVLGEATEPENRRHAAERLGKIDGKTEIVVPALIHALGWDIDPAVRGRAAQALGIIGAVTDDVVPALIEMLDWDDSLRVRWRVVEALERIGPVTDDVAWTLIAVMRGDKFPGVRARAAQAIGNICPASASVVPILTKAFLGDGHPGVRWQAAEALEKCAVNLQQAKATEALGSLREALMALSADNEPDIQTNAIAVRIVVQSLERELARE